MDEGGSKAKAGQLVSCLNILAKRAYGTLDDLHEFKTAPRCPTPWWLRLRRTMATPDGRSWRS